MFKHNDINGFKYRTHYFPPQGVWELENGVINVSKISNKLPLIEFNYFHGMPFLDIDDFKNRKKIEQKEIIERFISLEIENRYK